MAVTVRFDPEIERILNAVAKRRQMSRSDVVREAVVQYGAEHGVSDKQERPYDAWVDVIGVVSLGVRDPERTTGEQVAELVKRKARARRPR